MNEGIHLGTDSCRPLRGGVDRNTDYTGALDRRMNVAPFAGAWIETDTPAL